jgi:hypothetical protein
LPYPPHVLGLLGEKGWKSKNAHLRGAQKLKNKAGMFMIINDFLFWNRPKAGMFMKTGRLFKKAGILLVPSRIADIEQSDLRLYH